LSKGIAIVGAGVVDGASGAVEAERDVVVDVHDATAKMSRTALNLTARRYRTHLMQIHLDQVLAIAREAHQGQTRRHGTPYIAHPIAVRTLLEDLGPACNFAVDDAMRATALLHDVLEDSEIGADELRARFGDDVVRRVQILTKQGKGDEASRAYYAKMRAEADDATRLIKTCDRAHNFSEMHLAPDVEKLHKYITETLDLIVPVMQSASSPKLASALVAVLHDAMRAACRALRQPIPASVAQVERVPLGLYAIVQPHTSATTKDAVDDVVDHVTELVAGGACIIQLRAKNRTDRDVLALLDAAHAVTKRAGVPLVINDRADLCAAARVDGVHVGQTDLAPGLVRRIVGNASLVGASSHTEAQLHEINDEAAFGGSEGATVEGADLVAVGPVFESPTKSGHALVVGLDALARRCRISRLPVVAIGGITTPARAADCAKAGAHLAAAVSALDGPDARVIARRMSLAFVAAHASR
jgi:thiamine-phosphate pyrophosphorylase